MPCPPRHRRPHRAPGRPQVPRKLAGGHHPVRFTPTDPKLESASHCASTFGASIAAAIHSSCRSPDAFFSQVQQQTLVKTAVAARFWAGQACIWLPGKAAGAEAVRVDAYETRPGSAQADCIPEVQMLAEGSIHALAFTSTAEVGYSLRRSHSCACSQMTEQCHTGDFLVGA